MKMSVLRICPYALISLLPLSAQNRNNIPASSCYCLDRRIADVSPVKLSIA